MSHHDAMKLGKCADCTDGVLEHGPWTDDQIFEIAADIGIPSADFYDQCDQCFIDQVGLGDLAYAEKLAGRKLSTATVRDAHAIPDLAAPGIVTTPHQDAA